MGNKDYEIGHRHLNKLTRVAARNPGRYPLECLSVEKEGIVATCGRALARIPWDGCQAPEESSLIPVETAKYLADILNRNNRPSVIVELIVPEKGSGDSKYVSTVRKNQPPLNFEEKITWNEDTRPYANWKSVLPTDKPTAEMTLDVQYLKNSLEVLEEFTGENVHALTLRVYEHCITMVTKKGAYALNMEIGCEEDDLYPIPVDLQPEKKEEPEDDNLDDKDELIRKLQAENAALLEAAKENDHVKYLLTSRLDSAKELIIKMEESLKGTE